MAHTSVLHLREQMEPDATSNAEQPAACRAKRDGLQQIVSAHRSDLGPCEVQRPRRSVQEQLRSTWQCKAALRIAWAVTHSSA